MDCTTPDGGSYDLHQLESLCTLHHAVHNKYTAELDSRGTPPKKSSYDYAESLIAVTDGLIPHPRGNNNNNYAFDEAKRPC